MEAESRVPATSTLRGRLRLPDGWVVTPGLVDLQVNGYAGHQVDDAGALPHIAAALAADGVVAFCPTLVSRPLDDYRDAVQRLRTSPPHIGAHVAGVHLEGPFLSPDRAGAHCPSYLRAPDAARVAALAQLAPAIVTLAPELPGAIDAIRRLHRGGVRISAGHTCADAATMAQAIDAGVRMVTHAFNAIDPITARGPGGLAQALTDRRVRISLIGDGIHVQDAVARLVATCVGRRLILVSDASAPASAAAGRYVLGDRVVESDGHTVRTPDGVLAGSAVPLWQAVTRMANAGVPRAHVLDAVCNAPRRLLGSRTRLPASVVVIDEHNRPRAVLIDGRWEVPPPDAMAS